MVGSTEECTWIMLNGSSTSDEKMCIDVAERLYTEGIGRKGGINLPHVRGKHAVRTLARCFVEAKKDACVGRRYDLEGDMIG